VAEYAESTGNAIRPLIEPTFTIIPPMLLCWALMIGITCWVTLTTPKKFVSNCAFISSNDRSSNAPKRPYPALLTRTSILPFF